MHKSNAKARYLIQIKLPRQLGDIDRDPARLVAYERVMRLRHYENFT